MIHFDRFDHQMPRTVSVVAGCFRLRYSKFIHLQSAMSFIILMQRHVGSQYKLSYSWLIRYSDWNSLWIGCCFLFWIGVVGWRNFGLRTSVNSYLLYLLSIAVAAICDSNAQDHSCQVWPFYCWKYYAYYSIYVTVLAICFKFRISKCSPMNSANCYKPT